MKTMKTLTLILALSFAAAAQTVSTEIANVTLSGDPTDPVITNHSGKQIIAAEVVFTLNTGNPAVSDRLFTKTANVLPDGASDKFGRYAQNFTATAAKIVAVIFADGELRGDDKHNFQKDMERHIQSMRQSWQMAKARDWASLKAKADANALGDVFGSGIAQELLEIRAKQGDAAAVDAFAHLGNLPASTWKSGLINRLQFVPNVFQAIAEWIVPTVHAQSNPFSNVQPYPQGTDTDYWHPTQWYYTCSTYANPPTNYPCPDRGQSTPYEGSSALCTVGSYIIAVQVYLSMDVDYPRLVNSSGAIPGQYTLETSGYCLNNLFPSTRETWAYDKSCTGSNDPAPKKIHDSTNQICGAGFNGYTP